MNKDYEHELAIAKEEYRNVINEIEARSLENIEGDAAKVEVLKQDIGQVMTEAAKLREMITALEEHIIAGESRQEDLEAESGQAQQLEKLLQEQKDDSLVLAEHVQNLEADNKELVNQLEARKSQIEGVTQQITVLVSDNAEYKMKVAEMSKQGGEIEVVKSQLVRKAMIEESLTAKVCELSDKLAEAGVSKSFQMMTTNNKLEEAQTENEQLKRKLEKHEKLCSQLISWTKVIGTEQARILESAANHEQSILSAQAEEKEIRDVMDNQRKAMEALEVQHVIIEEAYASQEEHMKTVLEGRLVVLEAMSECDRAKLKAGEERDQMFASCAKQKEAVEALESLADISKM